MCLCPGGEAGVALRGGSAWPGCGDQRSGPLPLPLLSARVVRPCGEGLPRRFAEVWGCAGQEERRWEQPVPAGGEG